jgi:hypothetical protein
MTSITKSKELLNEKGTQILDLKKVLNDNQNNPLIYNGLLQSLKESDYGKEIYEALTSELVTPIAMERILITMETYVNQTILNKVFTDFQAKLSGALESKGQKYFSTKASSENGGIVVIRRFGINLGKLQREFRLTEKDALELLDNGFMKQFSTLKLNAFKKDIIEVIQDSIELSDYLLLNIEDLYFNEARTIYNIDFTITFVITEKYLNANYVEISKIADEIKAILTLAENQYSKIISNSEVEK